MQHSRLILSLAVALCATPAVADIIAMEDFDGGEVNLMSSTVPALDGGGGDWFGVAELGAWPQETGVPFSLADDTVVGVSGSVFEPDAEGLFGQARDTSDAFFAISDSDEFEDDQTASWTFDISGYTDLKLSIDMGAQSDGNSFGGFGGQTGAFTYAIDSVPVGTAIALASGDAPAGFEYREMDSGTLPATVGVMLASGDNTVTKFLADTGLAATNSALDKTPASGSGAGLMDTFTTDLAGSGSTLTITFVTDFPFEAMAFDNIVIEGTEIPEPTTALLFVGTLGVLLAARRR